MPILLDQNISTRLVEQLTDLFPGSVHTSKRGLERENDFVVWLYARDHNMTIITRDSDFFDLGLVKGFPPKIIWIRSGNTTSTYIQLLIRNIYLRIVNFINGDEQFCLELK